MSLDTQKAKDIKEFIDSGNTYIEAEEKFGIGRQTIRHYLKNNGYSADPYKNRTILTEKQIKHSIKMYKAGDTQQKILHNLRVTHTTLNRALKIKKFKVKKRWLLLTDSQAKKIKKMLVNGIRYKEIGRQLKIHPQKIFMYFKKYEVDGPPVIDFKPTHADYDNLIYFLSNEMERKDIAFELNTSVAFIRLMICKLGLYPYFQAFKVKRVNRTLSMQDVFDYINLKFQGSSNLYSVEKAGVSRVTMDHYLRQSEKMFLAIMENQKNQ